VNCRETQLLIHGYVDGEVDLAKSLEIEQHLHECPSCAQAHASIQETRTAIKQSSLGFQTPPDLSRRVRTSVRRAADAEHARGRGFGPLLAVAASIALAMAGGWGLGRLQRGGSGNGFLTQELFAAHVRSQMRPTHRFDVASTDAHTVKPWFEGKLDFAPPVKDLADRGFPLVGGRLDYVHHRPVAALLYQRRKHSINVFVWPSAAGDETGPKSATQQGFHMIRWSASGMTFWAVSDLNEIELQEFVELLQR
jgi:anti-sigma factor RsiW